MRRLLCIASITVAACTSVVAPDQNLTGTWSSSEHQLIATGAAAVLTTRCFTVQSGPLLLSDSLTFEATGVVTQAGGLITLRVGDAYPIRGRVVGADVLLGEDRLAPGRRGVIVCNVDVWMPAA
jgi:hypothetical protein